MGKKGTKRKTRWRALPLGEEDGGSGNEEELLDEGQSTTSSVVGQAPNNFRTSSAVYRTSERPYRQARRFPYDKFRHKEPLIKLESKTFDEEEYTKITTPRQDVLFKKGYFGRKKESSIEENVYNNSTNEVEGEEPLMDQIIITNGFVDERGHYLVNGSSYEIYDPYTNTVTVVVGPPPYANGVTPPVLAAVSCQPVPLTPVDWYPPGNEWGSQGPAWTPTYHQNPPNSADSVSSPGQSCESTPTSLGSEGQLPNLYHHTAYIPVPHGFVYEPPMYNGANGGTHQDGVNQTTEVMCVNDNSKLKKTRRKSEETVNENEIESNHVGENLSNTNNSQITAIETSKQDSNSSSDRIEDNKREQNGMHTPSTNEEERDEVKRVEKQSHSTQTNLLEAQKLLEKSAEVRVKESHSTQTNLDETFPNNNKNINVNSNNNKNYVHNNNNNHHNNNSLESSKLKELEKNETNRNLSDILLSSLTKKEQEPKVPWKTVNKFQKTSPRKPQEESPRKIYQKRTNFNERNENKQIPSVVTSPVKTSYAKKVMNGLENGSIQGNNANNSSSNNNNNNNNSKKLMVNGSNTVMNGSSQFAQNVNVNKTPLTNGTRQCSNEKNHYTENKRSQNNSKVNGNFNSSNYNNNKNNNYYEKQRFSRSLSNGKSPAAQKDSKERKLQLPEKQDNQKCLEISSESRSQSEKSSTVSELSSPTELSSGQNTPPEKLIVKKMEQKIANEINKSFEEKLKQNLTKEEESGPDETKEIKDEGKVEEVPEVKEEPVKSNKQKSTENKKKKNKTKTEEEKTKETPKSNKSKKKKKQSDESKDTNDYSNQDIPFLQPFIQQKPNEFLYNGWDKVKNQESDLISDIDSLLTANDDNILKSLGISEDKLNLSKLPLSSRFLKMLPSFNRDRPKFKFDDYFASTSTKQLHSDLCTKTNITNMKSTKPEEFFASIIENPNGNDARSSGSSSSSSSGVGSNNSSGTDKKAAKNGKKEEVSNDIETDKKETVKETNHGAQVIVKKSISIPKTGYKINKNNLKCKTIVAESKTEAKEEEDVSVKKNEKKPEEVKLGIVEAVNSWLKEEGDSEKLLSVNSLPQSFEKIESDDDEDTEPIQKNGLGNPTLALYADEKKDEDVDNVNMRVARIENWKLNNTRRYRSSSLDAKLSEKKIKKFLTESASYCHDLIGDVKNGVSLEYAREELCDPKENVLKYCTLSAAHTFKSKKAEESDSENEVFDVLEYKFLKQEGKNKKGIGNLSINDSGVQSDTESNEDNNNKKVNNPSERQPFPNKEVCNCKLQ